MNDAPFGLTEGATRSRCTRQRRTRATSGARTAQPLFDDSREYLDPALPGAGVDVPDTNTRIRVVSVDGTSMRIRIGVG